MDTRRLPWAAGQAFVGILMATTIFYTVTGFLWWLALNVAAGIAGLVAAALVSRPGPSMRASTVAAGLFAPVNLAIGLMGLIAGAAAPFALVCIAVGQVLLAWDSIGYAKREA